MAQRNDMGQASRRTQREHQNAGHGEHLLDADPNDIIESAIGGKNITTTVEGRERYPVNTRYARDFREDLDALKRVLVPTPTGAQVPISMLADIQYKTGPASVRSENGKLVGFVFVDVTTSDIAGYVRKA